jgi:hypothetical protein
MPELTTLLERLERLHRDLHDVVVEKIDRMRASDIDGMRECMEREGALVERIVEQEGLRRTLVDEMGFAGGGTAPGSRVGDDALRGKNGVGDDPVHPSRPRRPDRRVVGVANVRELARRMREPQRTEVTELANRLRSAVAKVAERNQVAGRIAREILRHLGHVFAAVTARSDEPPGSYSHCGGRSPGSARPLLDAVG